MKIAFAAVVVVSIGFPASWAQAEVAGELNGSVAGVVAELKAQASAADSEKILAAGSAVSDNILQGEPLYPPQIAPRMELNNDGDRVGAGVRYCAVYFETRGCRLITYVFPELRFDKASKQVFLGDTLIARDRGLWGGGLQLKGGYELKTEFVRRRVDTGFDRSDVLTLEVSLVQKTSR